jgi:hypothetical protein
MNPTLFPISTHRVGLPVSACDFSAPVGQKSDSSASNRCPSRSNLRISNLGQQTANSMKPTQPTNGPTLSPTDAPTESAHSVPTTSAPVEVRLTQSQQPVPSRVNEISTDQPTGDQRIHRCRLRCLCILRRRGSQCFTSGGPPDSSGSRWDGSTVQSGQPLELQIWAGADEM